MSAKDQIKQIVDFFSREKYLKNKTDGMAEGLLLGAILADEANERSLEVDGNFKILQQEYTENGNGSQSTAELIVARDGELILEDRLKRDFRKIDTQLVEITINVKTFGAKGDGITDDTNAIQQAINYANGNAFVYFPVPEVNYLISNLKAVTGKRLFMKGEDGRTSTLKQLDNATGYLIQLEAGYHFSSIQLNGNNKDGSYGFGSAYGEHTNVFTRNVIITDFEYGVKFDGEAYHPLQSEYTGVLVYNSRTCAIKIASTTSSQGQSAFSVDNVVLNNVNQEPISAVNVQTLPDLTSTSDKIYWDSGYGKEYGWTVMRRLKNSLNSNDWEVVGEPLQNETTITVKKVSGVYYDYEVLRRTVGFHAKWLKALNIGIIQSEYFSTGMWVERAYATEIGSFYSEWRSNLDRFTHPIPRGDGIVINTSSSTVIHTAWVENARYAIAIHSSTVDVGIVSAGGCVGGVFLNQLDGSYRSKIGKIQGTNNKLVFGDSSYRNYEMSDQDNDLEISLEKTISHVTNSKYTARHRGNVKAQLGANSDGGYVITNTLSVDMKTPANLKPVLKNNTYKKALQNNVSTPIFKATVVPNKAGALTMQFLIDVVESNFTIRQSITGTLTLAYSKTPGENTMGSIVISGETKNLQSGTLTNVFNLIRENDGITVASTILTSIGSPIIHIQLIPISALGEVVDVIVL